MDVGGVAIWATLLGGLLWLFLGRRSKVSGTVPDGPADEPYYVYTKVYDLTLVAREVPRKFAADAFLADKGWLSHDRTVWDSQVGVARDIRRAIPDRLGFDIAASFKHWNAADWAICFLIDHSGSMRDDPIVHTAASVRWMSDQLVSAGAKVSVRGFSTVGWRGGRPAEDWVRNGRPNRPGRLCELMHIDYQFFGETITDQDWEVMLNPDVLRENVDGEALEWAATRLKERPERHRLLVMLSDGAPVDDATLTHNGPSFLQRHLLSIIDHIEVEGKITLAALGIGFDVGRYYRRSRSTTDLAEMPNTMVGLIADIIREQSIL
jgi:cobaltochelatase CobT